MSDSHVLETDAVLIPVLSGDGFIIRPFQSSDRHSLQSALNDPLVTQRLTNIPQPYTYADAWNWICHSDKLVQENSKRVSFAIIIDDQVAGSVSFINFYMLQQNVQLSIWVVRKHWGKGIAGKAIKLLLQFGFEKLGLYRVFAFYVEDNIKSKSMLKKLGFQVEGVHRKEWKKLVDGEWKRFDSVHCSLLKPEWEGE